MTAHNTKSMQSVKTKTWIVLLAGLMLLGGIVYANYQITRQNASGFDFLLRWYPARLFLFEGYDSPYSDAVTRQVEIFLYGHPAEQGELEGYFAYPFYTIFVLFPFILIKDFPLARSLWMTVLELSHIAIVLLSLRMTGFRPKALTFFLLTAIALATSYFIEPILDGNPGSLAALCIVFCIYFLRQKKDWLAGIFLSLAAIKPQLAILFFALVWLWAFSQKRWNVLYSSFIMVGVLLGTSFLMLPGWLTEFIHQMAIYGQKYGANSSAAVLQRVFPNVYRQLSLILTIISAGLLVFEWVQLYRKDFAHFYWTFCITTVLLPLTGIVFGNQNMSILLPAITLLTAVVFRTYPKLSILWNSILGIFIPYSWAAFFLWYSIPLLWFGNYLPIPIALAIGLYAMRSKILAP